MLRSKRELSAMRYPLAKITAAALVAGLSLVASSCRTSGNERPELVAQETTRASRPEVTTVRPTAVAGPRGMGFYTDDEAQLREQVEGFLRDVPETELDGELVALMVPHAGLVYSGPIAAYSYRTLADRQISRIVLIGNSHTASFAGVAVSPDAAWDTPLGPVTVDRDAVEQLLDIGAPFSESRRVHANEHCLEVQLPFIKAAVPDATIVPMLISRPSTEEIAEIADALLPLIQEPGTILVASSDMAHYPVYDEAVKSDRALLDAIVTLDPEQIAAKDDEMMGQGVKELHCTLCGLESVLVAVTTANQMGDAKATVLDYRNSGDTAGDKGRCVGYGAVAFTVANTEDAPSVESGTQTRDASGLTDADRIRLLKVARQTLEAELDGGDMPSLDPGDSAALAKETACFVTLKMDGKLRGCIGELEPRDPLIKAVSGRAIAAALQDPRFRPVKARDLPKIDIDISAVTPLRRIDSAEEFIVGKHGIVVSQGGRRGVFLPQVAPEQGWDRETTLDILCRDKAGLPEDAWKTGAELWVFSADVFSEGDFDLGPANAD